MPNLSVFYFKEPAKWQAGKVGGEPFYYNCFHCPSELIAGGLISGTEYKFERIIVRSGDWAPLFKLAIFCQEHLEQEARAVGVEQERTV